MLKNNKKIGRPEMLTPETTMQIRSLYFEGKNIKNIQIILNINPKTWQSWYRRDFQGFRVFIWEIRKERLLGLAYVNLMQFLTIPMSTREVITSNGPRVVIDTDYRLLRLKLDATKYVSSKFDTRFKLDNNHPHM